MNQIMRPFVESDRETYLAMSRIFYTTGAVAHPVPDDNFHRTFDQCLTDNPYTKGFMLLHGGAVAGFALLSFTWSNEVGGMSVLLEEAYLDPAYRGSGLGTKFLQAVEEQYRGKALRLRLEVSPGNHDAIRLYQRLGFSDLPYNQMIKDYS